MSFFVTKLALCSALAAGAIAPNAAAEPAWQSAVSGAGRIAPGARIVVLDVSSGRLLAAAHLDESARTLAAPGSTLKPLLLFRLIEEGRWDPGRRIACSRTLRIAGRSLACSHPAAASSLNAAEALAWSCNTYFAALAGSIRPQQLRPLLATTGILGQTGLANVSSPAAEVTAAFRDPATISAVQLAALGVDGIRVSPLELAAAYRWLALQIASHPDSQAAQVVLAGLSDSAAFGIAGAASSGGVAVAGKTGTANLGAGTASHGWFAGFAPLKRPSVIVCIYLPSGHGADAAAVAAALLARSPLKAAEP